MGISRNGLSTNKSLSPDTMRSARPLTASSRNLSSLGSRHAAICSVMVTVSAPASSFESHSRKRGAISGARRGLAMTCNNSCSVAEDLSRQPRCSIRYTARAGREVSFKTALTSTFVSTTILIQRPKCTSSRASSISRSIASSFIPAAMTRARVSFRPGINSLSGSKVMVTRSCGGMPRRMSSAVTSPAVLSMVCWVMFHLTLGNRQSRCAADHEPVISKLVRQSTSLFRLCPESTSGVLAATGREPLGK